MQFNRIKNVGVFFKLILIIIFSMLALKGMSMSLLTNPEEKIILSSQIEGHITYKGLPASGAKIIRIVKWKDETGEKDNTNTDSAGYFFLPTIDVSAKLSKLTQFSTSQDLIVHYNNSEYIVWTVGRITKSIYSELGGIPINFRCELTDEEEPLRINGSLVLTSCKWDKIEKIL